MKSKSVNPNLNLFPVASGVWGMKDVFVNLYMILNPDDNSWVLVDSGLKWSAGKIRRMAQLLFGENAKPTAILLTHGHFDHTGSVSALAEGWNVPVYAHHLELPYLTGVSSYPPADATVGGGIFSDLSFLYSRKPINISGRVLALPSDGTVPGLPDWKYVHSPGHTPGHVSLFREKDRVLIAGDAVVTTKAESFWFTALQVKKISGPPKYLTSDWLSSAASVEELASLEPKIIASGHGRPIRGSGMRKSLHNLADNFDRLAVPGHGRYIHQPALSDDTGVVHIPPKNSYDTSAPTLKVLGITVAVLISVLVIGKSRKKKVRRALNEDEKLAKKYRNQAEKEAAVASKPVVNVAEEIQHLKASAIARIRQSGRNMEEKIQKLQKTAKKKFNEVEKASAEKYFEIEKASAKKYHEIEKASARKFLELEKASSGTYHQIEKGAKQKLDHAEDLVKDKLHRAEDAARGKFREVKKSAGQIRKEVAPVFIDFLDKLKFDLKKTARRR